MKTPIRRLTDGAAGAIVAVVILAGGTAYAATGGFHDTSTPVEPAVTIATPAPTTTVDDWGSEHATETETHNGAESTTTPMARIDSTDAAPSTTAAPTTTTRPEHATAVEHSGASSTTTPEVEAAETETEHHGNGGVHAKSDATTPSSTTVAPDGATTAFRTIQSVGGSVTVSVTNGVMSLVAATPAAGFATRVENSGSTKIEVRFTNAKRESRIEIEIEHGLPRERVEER